MMEALIKKVKRGRFVLLPITDQTRGHGTHTLPGDLGRAAGGVPGDGAAVNWMRAAVLAAVLAAGADVLAGQPHGRAAGRPRRRAPARRGRAALSARSRAPSRRGCVLDERHALREHRPGRAIEPAPGGARDRPRHPQGRRAAAGLRRRPGARRRRADSAHVAERHARFVYDRRTFARQGEFTYRGEGWGLCHDGTAAGDERRLGESDVPPRRPTSASCGRCR